MLTFTNDFSRKTLGYLLCNKSEEFNTFVENQLGLKIKRLRSDSGKKCCNRSFINYFKQQGIIRDTSAPYSPEQICVSEGLNRAIFENARYMLEDSCLSRRCWGYNVMTAIYSKNCSSSSA